MGGLDRRHSAEDGSWSPLCSTCGLLCRLNETAGRALSQELAENDLQTDPENHLHPQPHLSTPIITLFPPHSDE